MTTQKWNERFFSSTRGRLLALLRSASYTVNELAATLQLTPNAVRAHLATLERDGLVQQHGIRRGFRKPHYVYQLTPVAEQFFPKAYDVLLRQVLQVLEQRLSDEALEEILRAVGQNLATAYRSAVQGTTLKERIQASVRILEELGGLPKSEQQNGHFLIHSTSCPLAAVVADHPQACVLAEALLAELTGATVQERCQRSVPPQCRFEIVETAPGGRASSSVSKESG
jgi:predicted ArsR family transcriptional regulator